MSLIVSGRARPCCADAPHLCERRTPLAAPPARTAPPVPTRRARRRIAAGRKLDRQIDGWLAAAGAAREPGAPPPRAIIGPHAGHRYCGHVMAHAYASIDPTVV
jgi:hypothetical protein